MPIAVYDNGSLTPARGAATKFGAPLFRQRISAGGGSGDGFTVAIPFRNGARMNTECEADLIPDWTVIAVAIGTVVAVAAFVAAWFTDGGFATLTLTVGLLLIAGGMAGAEEAIGRGK